MALKEGGAPREPPEGQTHLRAFQLLCQTGNDGNQFLERGQYGRARWEYLKIIRYLAGSGLIDQFLLAKAYLGLMLVESRQPTVGLKALALGKPLEGISGLMEPLGFLHGPAHHCFKSPMLSPQDHRLFEQLCAVARGRSQDSPLEAMAPWDVRLATQARFPVLLITRRVVAAVIEKASPPPLPPDLAGKELVLSGMEGYPGDEVFNAQLAQAVAAHASRPRAGGGREAPRPAVEPPPRGEGSSIPSPGREVPSVGPLLEKLRQRLQQLGPVPLEVQRRVVVFVLLVGLIGLIALALRSCLTPAVTPLATSSPTAPRLTSPDLPMWLMIHGQSDRVEVFVNNDGRCSARSLWLDRPNSRAGRARIDIPTSELEALVAEVSLLHENRMGPDSLELKMGRFHRQVWLPLTDPRARRLLDSPSVKLVVKEARAARPR